MDRPNLWSLSTSPCPDFDLLASLSEGALSLYWALSDHSGLPSHLRILNFITTTKVLLQRKVTYAQVLGMETFGHLRGAIILST